MEFYLNGSMELYKSFNGFKMKFLIIVVLAFFISVAFADERLQRERELSEMQSLIEEQRRSALEAEQRKQSAIQSRQQTQLQLNTAQRRVQELDTAQQNLQRSLDFSSNILNQTESRLSQLQASINHTMLFLLFADQAEEKLKQQDSDAQLLSIYLQKLFEENSRLNAEITTISQERQTREREFTEAQNRSRDEQSRIDTISTDLQRLETDIETFERQRASYQTRANELERSAMALQNLINSFRDPASGHQVTYQFPNGIEPPLNGRIITSFGPRRNERYNISTISNGIDIAVAENTYVRAFSDGEIVFSDVFTGSGRMVIIDHKNGFHTVYGYNNDLLVQKGDMVSKGQVIARSGMTGSATEPSLHFELRRSGQPVNPLEYINIMP